MPIPTLWGSSLLHKKVFEILWSSFMTLIPELHVYSEDALISTCFPLLYCIIWSLYGVVVILGIIYKYLYLYCVVLFPGRYYCPGGGIITPTLLCSAGYYCEQGAETSTPIQGMDANICPQGYYCEEGTDAPVQCPLGTFSNQTGLKNLTDCTPCPQGESNTNTWQSLTKNILPVHKKHTVCCLKEGRKLAFFFL